MEPGVKDTIIGLLDSYPSTLRHHTWNSQYRDIIISFCGNIIEQCSKEDFCAGNTTYCKKVQEACETFLKRVNGEDLDKDGECRKWPRNIDWFDSEDHVSSFTCCLFYKAHTFAPANGLLNQLQLFMDKEAPCSSYCIGKCGYQGCIYCWE